MEEIGVPGGNHRPAASHWQTLSHNVVSSARGLGGIRTHNVSGDMYWLHWYNVVINPTTVKSRRPLFGSVKAYNDIYLVLYFFLFSV